jgi:cullin-4
LSNKTKSIKKKITKDDVFEVNMNFRSKLRRVTINSLQRKETKQETQAIHDKVLQDRKYLIDAAIVRTMKAKRTVTHNDLVTEVIRLVRFPLDIQ